MIRVLKEKFHELHVRYIEPHHANSKVRSVIENGTYAVSIMGIIAILPQISKIFVEQNVSGVSVYGYLFGVIGALFWFSYGVFYRLKPVIFINFIWVFLNIAIVVGILKH